MKTSHLPMLLALMGALTPTSHAAAILGINFNNFDVAGAQADGNFGATWTNIDAASGQDLAANGTASAVNIDWAASNFWAAGSWMSTNTSPSNGFGMPIGMMRVYLDDGDTAAAGYAADMGVSASDGIGVSVRLQGMNAWLTAEGMTAYTIRAFYSTDSEAASFGTISVRDGGTVNSPILGSVSGTAQGVGGWDGTANDAGGNIQAGTRGDAVLLGQFNADTMTLTIDSRSGNQRGSLAGFIITAVPEPSAALLGGCGLLALLRRRRA